MVAPAPSRPGSTWRCCGQPIASVRAHTCSARRAVHGLDARTSPAAHLPAPWDALYAAATSRLVRRLLGRLAFAGVPAPVLEHVLIPGRRFRADLAWPDRLVYVECDGATFVPGRHGSGSGIKSDCEKFSLAAGLGWRLVRVEEMWLRTERPVEWVRAALAWRAA